MRKRTTFPMAVATLLLLPVPLWSCSEAGSGGSGDGAEAAGLPAGYALRLDRMNRDPADFAVEVTGRGVHVETGPAGILYRDVDTVEEGDYAVSATFTEVGAPPGHREGMGLFVGGQGLQGSAQRYTYFLVRADGSYLIKRREGDETPNVTDNWVESDVLDRAAGVEDVTNALRIEVEGGVVRFLVNGTEVYQGDAGVLPVYGTAGLRVNHNLNLFVEGFRVER